MKRYKGAIFCSIIVLFLVTLGGVLPHLRENGVYADEKEEKIKQEQSSNLEDSSLSKKENINNIDTRLTSADINWDNWQVNSSIQNLDGTYFKINTEFSDPIIDGYDKKVTRQYTITLTKSGDTIPEYQNRGMGDFLKRRDGGYIDNPLSDFQKYSPETTITLGGKLNNWTNLPETFKNGSGDSFNLQEENYDLNGNSFPYTQSWAFYSLYSDNIWPNLDINKRIRYKFDTGMNSTVALTHVFHIKTIKDIPKEQSVGAGTSVYLLNPQVVKSQFKSIDEPNKELSSEEVNGKGLAMRDKVSSSSKEIEDYEFDHYEFIDEKGHTSTGKDKTWSSQMDDTKKMIIFWYKKKLPEVPDINLTKTANKDEANLNEKISYSLGIENTSSATGELKNAKVMDILPDGMSRPENVRLNGEILQEKPESSNGDYYSWDDTEKKLMIYVQSVLKNDKKIVTYDSRITSGNSGEKKINRATLTGENTEQQKMAEALVTLNILLKVEFESNGGTLIENQSVQHGKNALRPIDPSKENQLFIGWFEDEKLTSVWDFNTPIFKDTKLYAKWRRTIVDPGDGVTPIVPKNPDGSDKETNQTNADFRIQYVSDFDFGEQVVTTNAVQYLANGDYGENSKNGMVRVPSFISIIDDRPNEQSAPWELRGKATDFKNSDGKILKGANLLLTDLFVANNGGNIPFPHIGELNLTEGSTIATTKGEKIGEGTWSVAFGNLDEYSRTAGVKLDLKKGPAQSTLSDYKSTIDWELITGP